MLQNNVTKFLSSCKPKCHDRRYKQMAVGAWVHCWKTGMSFFLMKKWTLQGLCMDFATTSTAAKVTVRATPNEVHVWRSLHEPLPMALKSPCLDHRLDRCDDRKKKKVGELRRRIGVIGQVLTSSFRKPRCSPPKNEPFSQEMHSKLQFSSVQIGSRPTLLSRQGGKG